MRKNVLLYISLLLVIFGCKNVLAQKPAKKKYGVIIAIGDYATETGWKKINSLNDVSLIKKALEKQGFPSGNIQTITNQDATRSGISQGIKNLINSVNSGDVAVIHISSHGSQIEDDKIKDESDGLDEAIVPFDALSSAASKDFEKDQAKYFRDDEFGVLVSALRQKLGKDGDVLVIIDACHSGSGTRGTAKARGDLQPLVSKNFDLQNNLKNKDDGVFREGSASRGDETSMATYVVISGARAAELNQETYDDDFNPVGSLSYSISKVFENLDTFSTYRSLFANIQGIMIQKVPSQQPVLEGNGLDRQLFGGAIVAQKPFVEVKSIENQTIIVKGGILSGLDAGAKVDLYKAGTKNIDNKEGLIAEGKVISATMYESTIQTEKSLEGTKPVQVWAFVTETVFKIEPIKFDIITAQNQPIKDFATSFFTAEEVQHTKAKLKDEPLVEFNAKPELVLRKGGSEDDLVITSSGHVFRSFKNREDYSTDLKDAIKGFAQYKVLLQDIKSDKFKIQVKLAPVVNEKADTVSFSANNLRGGVMEFKPGETVRVWVRNDCDFPVYINILDLLPNGKIQPYLPYRDLSIYPEDLQIAAHTSRLFENPIEVTEPYGTEVFKVFVSRDKIDMEQIATSKGSGSRGNLNSLESLFKDTYSKSRGEPKAVKSDGMTLSVPFNVVKK
jgi:hypothetical protein